MRLRGLVILVLAAGVGYWIYKTRPTVAGLVDGVTRPLMGSKAAVKESERKRIVNEAVPAAPEGEQFSTATIREGMKKAEVEELIGKPDNVQQIDENGRTRFRCTYTAARKVLVYEEGRVVSVSVAE